MRGRNRRKAPGVRRDRLLTVTSSKPLPENLALNKKPPSYQAIPNLKPDSDHLNISISPDLYRVAAFEVR